MALRSSPWGLPWDARASSDIGCDSATAISYAIPLGEMHQTTLRFPEDLWRFLEEEAKSLGVSVAQYVREAALARAAYDAGRRGEPIFVDPAVIRSGVSLSSIGGPERRPAPHERAIASARETTTDSS